MMPIRLAFAKLLHACPHLAQRNSSKFQHLSFVQISLPLARTSDAGVLALARVFSSHEKRLGTERW